MELPDVPKPEKNVPRKLEAALWLIIIMNATVCAAFSHWVSQVDGALEKLAIIGFAFAISGGLTKLCIYDAWHTAIESLEKKVDRLTHREMAMRAWFAQKQLLWSSEPKEIVNDNGNYVARSVTDSGQLSVLRARYEKFDDVNYPTK